VLYVYHTFVVHYVLARKCLLKASEDTPINFCQNVNSHFLLMRSTCILSLEAVCSPGMVRKPVIIAKNFWAWGYWIGFNYCILCRRGV